MRTTLTLEPDVAAKLKAEMRRSGKSFKETVNEVLRFGFLSRENRKPVAPFVVHARNLGLRPGLNYDCISQLIEEVEGPLHR